MGASWPSRDKKGARRIGASTQSNLRGVSRLTDRAVKAFVANATVGGKLSEGVGFYAERTAGGLSWRVKYRYAGAERRYSIGSVPLAQARVERDRVKAPADGDASTSTLHTVGVGPFLQHVGEDASQRRARSTPRHGASWV